MTQTSYVNPNGLPAEGQITSARDLAILARAIIRDLPEYEYFMHIPAIRFGRRVTSNYNKLIGRYPGADGFKTGFICASGYNLVASATRNGKRLIAVVLGSPSGHVRAVKAAQLLERGFSNNGLSWLTPSLGSVDNLVPINASPPNLRDEMCGGKRKRPASDEDDGHRGRRRQRRAAAKRGTFFTAGLQPPMAQAVGTAAAGAGASEPILVYTGPKKTGPALIAAVAADAEKQTPRQARQEIAGRGEEAGRCERRRRPKPMRSPRPNRRRQACDAKPKPLPTGRLGRKKPAARQSRQPPPTSRPPKARAKAADPRPPPNPRKREAKPAGQAAAKPRN